LGKDPKFCLFFIDFQAKTKKTKIKQKIKIYKSNKKRKKYKIFVKRKSTKKYKIFPTKKIIQIEKKYAKNK